MPYFRFVMVWVLLIPTICRAQLLPNIGIAALPSDNTPICPIPWYLGSFYTSGLQEGNFAHDFKLYDLNGDSLVLSQKLANGKPVLLIAGSLTCPVFMGKIPLINQVIATYGNQLQVFVIYVLEAHPTDTSVYFGYVNTTQQNINAGILFPQPQTYGERKHLADTLDYWATLNAPAFIDGPCNEWWSTFGPAPNNAYLIEPNGKIFAKHGWFHKNQDNIFCDIDSLLNINSGMCNQAPPTGTFQMQVLNNMASGNAGSLLYDYANLINNSNNDVMIGIKKLQKNLPPGWQTAFCADVCYSPTDDSITVIIPPQDTLLFSLDFITNALPDSGSVKVGFRNVNDANNTFQTTFRAYTTPLQIEAHTSVQATTLYPNPADNFICLRGSHIPPSVSIRDIAGREQRVPVNDQRIDIAALPSGLYILRYQIRGQQYLHRFYKY